MIIFLLTILVMIKCLSIITCEKYTWQHRSEKSFGVAVLEAGACGNPVIVSNVGGLPEVVKNGKAGFIVEKENPDALADVLEKLILDPDLRTEMGNNERNKDIKEFSCEESVDKMLSVYNDIIRH